MSPKSDPVTENLPVVQTLVHDVPQDQKDSFRRSKAATAIVLQNLRIASMRIQDDYRTLVQEADNAEKTLDRAIAQLAARLQKDAVVDVDLAFGDVTANVRCPVESVTVSLSRIQDSTRYVQTVVLKVGHPEKESKYSGYRDTWEFTRSGKPDAALRRLRKDLDELWTKKLELEKQMAELKGDIIKAEKLGDIVEGQEAIANMTADDREVVQDSLNAFNRYLSNTGKTVMKGNRLLGA